MRAFPARRSGVNSICWRSSTPSINAREETTRSLRPASSPSSLRIECNWRPPTLSIFPRNRPASARCTETRCRRGSSALLTDLKQRGLLADTLVICGGEFGRTPAVEVPAPGTPGKGKGRDHNHYGFTVWLAGGGVKGGYVHGATDEFGYRAVEEPVHVHDLHATMLHLLGFDHEKLTYRYAGRDFRLTDVSGEVVKDILAK